MTITSDSNSWLAVQVRPKCELSSAVILRAKGYEEFVPVYRRKRQWSDRCKEVQVPLFTGYVFCKFNGILDSRIVTTPGVIRLVTAGGKQIAHVSDEEIESIRAAINQGFDVLPWAGPKIGSTIRVKAGPLAGAVGVLTSFKNRKYIILTIDAVQRSIAVPLDQCESAELVSDRRD